MEPVMEQRKRNVAYKLTIGEILRAKPVYGDDKMLFVELGGLNVVRVNIIANCIDKFSSDNNEKKYASLTLDDASGQIRLKVFGDDVGMVEEALQGDTMQVVGNVRIWNDELYIIPEIMKKVDPRWLLVRKLEVQKRRNENPFSQSLEGSTRSNNGEESGFANQGGAGSSQGGGSNVVKDEVMKKIKDSEVDGGIDIDTLVMGSDLSPDAINGEIKKLLEEGLIYEPRPGRLRYLG